MEGIQPKPSHPSDAASFSVNSKLPAVATAGSAKTAIISKPSSAPLSLVSVIRKNLADKIVPLQANGDGSAPLTFVPGGKMDTLKTSQEGGVVHTMHLAQPYLINSSHVNPTVTNPVTSTQVYFTVPISAASTPVSAAKTVLPSSVRPTSTINILPNQPLLMMKGLPQGSRTAIVTSLSNASCNQEMVLASSPYTVTPTNGNIRNIGQPRVLGNIAPSTSSTVVSSGYEVLDSPTIPVTHLIPFGSPPPPSPTPTRAPPPGSIVRTYSQASEPTSTMGTILASPTPKYIVATPPYSKPVPASKGELKRVQEVLTPMVYSRWLPYPPGRRQVPKESNVAKKRAVRSKDVIHQIAQPFSLLSPDPTQIGIDERVRESSFQWHHPSPVSTEPKTNEQNVKGTVELGVKPESESLRGRSATPTLRKLLENVPQIANNEIRDRKELQIKEILSLETVTTARLKMEQDPLSASTLGPGSLIKWHCPQGDPVSQSEPARSEIIMPDHTKLSGRTEGESAAHPGKEEPVLLSSDNDEPSNPSSPVPKPAEEGPENTEFHKLPSDEFTSIIKSDPDIPTVHNRIHPSGETAKALEYSIKTEMSGMGCQEEPLSPSFRNPEAKPDDAPSSSSLGDKTAMSNLKLDPDASERPLAVDESETTHPRVMVKFNNDRLRKIQTSLKTRLKMKGKSQVSLKRTASEISDAPPNKSKEAGGSCDAGPSRSSLPGHSRSSGRMQEGSKTVEPNVLRDCIVRKTIQDCYSKKQIATLEMIHAACCDSGLNFSIESVHAHLKSIGYNWVACDAGVLLIEDPRLTTKRIEYLEQLETYSQRNLVYVLVSESITKTETGWKTRPYSDWGDLRSKDIVLHAIDNTSLIEDCLLIINLMGGGFSVKHQIRHWLQTAVFPKIPKNSVIIVGDGIYELTSEPEERPHVGQSKAEIISWLKAHKVKVVNPNVPKAVLLSKALDTVLPKTSIFDKVVEENGFEILHLPKHHRDLNPMEFLWQDIFDKLTKTPAVIDSHDFRDFVFVEFKFCNTKVSSVACYLVRKFEMAYRDFDFGFDKVLDSMMIVVGNVTAANVSEPELKPSQRRSKSDEVKPESASRPCEVCLRATKQSRFACSKCKFFWYHLVESRKEGKPLPVCKLFFHSASRPYTCNGCRRHKYEVAFLKHCPGKPLPIPPVTFEGEEFSRIVPPKNYPIRTKPRLAPCKISEL